MQNNNTSETKDKLTEVQDASIVILQEQLRLIKAKGERLEQLENADVQCLRMGIEIKKLIKEDFEDEVLKIKRSLKNEYYKMLKNDGYTKVKKNNRKSI